MSTKTRAALRIFSEEGTTRVKVCPKNSGNYLFLETFLTAFLTGFLATAFFAGLFLATAFLATAFLTGFLVTAIVSHIKK